MDRATIIPNPDCISIENDPDFAHQALAPLIVDGTIYFPATHADMGNITADGTQMLAIMLAGPVGMGLQVQLTPQGARSWLRAMEAGIARAEAANAAQAKAQLAATLNRRKQP